MSGTNRDVTISLSVVQKAGSAAKAAGQAISGIGGHSFGGIGAALGPEGAVVGGVLDQISKFASKANPQAFQQLERVFDDLAAVIGQVFVPPMQTLTQLFRIAADVTADWLDPIAELVKSAFGVIDALMPIVRIFMKIQGLPMQVIVKLLSLLSPLLDALASSIEKMVDSVASALSGIYDLLPDWLKEYLDRSASAGRAPGSGGGSVGIAALGSSVQQTAFNSGAGIKQVAENTKKMEEHLRKMAGHDQWGTDTAIDGTRSGGDF